MEVEDSFQPMWRVNFPPRPKWCPAKDTHLFFDGAQQLLTGVRLWNTKTSPHCTFALFLSLKTNPSSYVNDSTLSSFVRFSFDFNSPPWTLTCHDCCHGCACLQSAEGSLLSDERLPAARAARLHLPPQTPLKDTHARSGHRRNRLMNQNKDGTVRGLELIKIQRNAFFDHPKCDHNSPWLQFLHAEL